MRQARDVIWSRRDEEEQRRLRLEETKLQYLVGAVHAAAGNKKGARLAQRIRLRPKRRGDTATVPSRQAMLRLFPVDPGVGGLIDMAEVQRKADEIRSELVTADG